MSDAPQAVVFDIGNVLFRWDLRYLYAKLIDDPEELEWFLDNVITMAWHTQHDAGKSFAEMVPELAARFPDHAHLVQAYGDRFLETISGPVPGTAQLVERLVARGVPLFALTNFGVESWERFRPGAPIFRHFRDIVVSGHEQCAKPDDRIYAIAEQRFGLGPGELFFTDDSPANVAAARARNWHAHLFDGAEGLEAELVRLGLLA